MTKRHHYFTIVIICLVCLGVSFFISPGKARQVHAAQSNNIVKHASMLSSSGKAFDIRARAGLSSTPFRIMEGACTDGSYGYYTFLRSKTSSCKIVKVALASIGSAPNKAVVKVSGELFMGHANDMCYNPTTKKIYVIHNMEGTLPSMKISVVDPASLSRIGTFTLKIPETLDGATVSQLTSIKGLCAISYLASADHYVVMLSGIYGNFMVLDKDFNPVRFIKCEKRSPWINQGIDCNDTSIFVGRSSGSGANYSNIIEEYNWDGKHISQTTIKGLTYEIESIYHIGKNYYLSCYAYNKLLNPNTFGFVCGISSTVSVTGIRAGNPSLVISVGSTASLKASVTPLNAKVRSITYLCGNNKVVNVSSSGICRGLSPGEANIIMYSNQGYYTTTAHVTVVGKPRITAISNQTGGIHLSWPAQASSTRITIWRRKGKDPKAGFKKLAVVSGSKGSYIDYRAKGGKFYSYRLSASNGKVTTGYSPFKSMWRLRTPKMPKLKYADSSGLEIRWKKTRGASYYSIQYSYSSDFRKKKTVRVKENAPRQLLIKKKLKKGKTCYVRIYACHKGGKKVYSQPSATAKIKIH